MKRENIGIISSASLLFAALLIVAYIYVYGALSPVQSYPTVGVESLLSGGLRWIQLQAPIFSTLLSLATIVIGAMLNVSVPTRFNLFGRASQIPIFIYISVIVGFSSSGDILSAPFAALCGVCSLRDFYRAYNSSSYTSKLFLATIWMGVLPLLYPAAIVLWVAAFIFMVMFVRTLREILVVCMGLMLPLFSYVYVSWLLGANFIDQIVRFVHTITLQYNHSPDLWAGSTITLYIALATLFALLSLYGVLQVGIMSLRYVARIRIYCSYILVALGCAMLILPSFSFESFIVLAAPLSIAVTPALLRLRSWFAMPLFFVILALVTFSLFEVYLLI